ncbi:hypothetical protein DEA8626_02230 [Defluviimonas aquaemixtae]|uniref:IcmF-related protein n=1 Tax=Albidovulum aquaemixtae TaxID=1542388 RepID=A0A2R8B7X4_9RHOB|nr:ImcF-related family protein [Defluviimonas aquaemixtae]SPH18688.1 hypothetical protein DEA8626_02230 [Defluviimonas aquaemixtae]
MAGRDGKSGKPTTGRGGPAASAASPEPYESRARPVLDFAAGLATEARPDAARQVERAAILLDRFSDALRRAGVGASTIPPARYALALIVDQRARSNRRLDIRTWSAAAHRHLFDGRDLSVARLEEFIRRAEAAGPDFDAVRAFLGTCLARLEDKRRHFDRSTGPNWTGIALVLIGGFMLAVAGWAAYVEWRYHRDLAQAFASEALEIGLDRQGEVPDLAGRLDRLDAAAGRVETQAERAPLSLFAGALGFDAAARAWESYDDALARHLPGVLARALDTAIATEGENVALYDDLRAWRVLSGQDDWSPAYLAGWSADRADEGLGLEGLSPHVARLARPSRPLPPPDPELLDQARDFAAQAGEAERAFLELRRSTSVAALPGWRASDAVPGIDQLLLRRSGLPMSRPIPGLYTAGGWALARDREAGLAVQGARDAAVRIFDAELPAEIDAPDRVMTLLQRATLAQWRTYVADLRVRPFSDPDNAVFISGRLALSPSPLEAFLRAVWNEAGGTDRQRPHALQLSVATEFGPMIQYVEQGRMREISALFAALNVALGAMDRDEEAGLQRLMTIQDRAASIAALRQAPLVVVQIVEDVLAQTSAAHADLMTNPLTRAWQSEVLPLCQEAVEGRYPFADGPDADLAAVSRLLGPGGAVERYFRARAEPYVDTNAALWRWKPEARFAGLAPESAAFFQRARAISEGLFAPDGRLGTAMALSALAERGRAFIAVGGAGGPVETRTDSLSLDWPGAAAESGVQVTFETPEGAAEMAGPGPWGLFRLLDPVRLRERDEGRRYLVDLRAGGGRLFLEIGFDRAENPLSRRRLLDGFTCPPVL